MAFHPGSSLSRREREGGLGVCFFLVEGKGATKPRSQASSLRPFCGTPTKLKSAPWTLDSERGAPRLRNWYCVNSAGALEFWLGLPCPVLLASYRFIPMGHGFIDSEVELQSEVIFAIPAPAIYPQVEAST